MPGSKRKTGGAPEPAPTEQEIQSKFITFLKNDNTGIEAYNLAKEYPQYITPEFINRPIDNEERSVLMYSLKEQSLEQVKKLLELGADPNKKDKFGNNSLFYAAANNAPEDVSEDKTEDVLDTLIADGADVKVRNKNGETPLFYAASAGNNTVLRYLVEEGINVNIKDNNGETALFYAARHQKVDIVFYLVRYGNANPDIVNKEGKKAINYALRGDIQMILRDHMQDVDYNNSNNNNNDSVNDNNYNNSNNNNNDSVNDNNYRPVEPNDPSNTNSNQNEKNNGSTDPEAHPPSNKREPSPVEGGRRRAVKNRKTRRRVSSKRKTQKRRQQTKRR